MGMDEKFSLSYNAEIYQRYIVFSKAHFKHITHYGPRSGSLYYDMTTLYLPPRDALSSSVSELLERSEPSSDHKCTIL
jgi:hypothetical protein